MTESHVAAITAYAGLIVGALGVIVGALATYVGQERVWRRTTRRELYGDLAGKGPECLHSMLDVRHAIKHDGAGLDEYWKKANADLARVSALRAQVGILAGTKTQESAQKLERHLVSLGSELYRRQKNCREPLKTYEEYRDGFGAVLQDFVSAAGNELRLGRRNSN